MIAACQIDFQAIQTALTNLFGQNIPITSGLASDVSTSSTTFVDVTGLSFPVLAGRIYSFKFTVDYTSSATTNGFGIGLNGPAAPTRLSYETRVNKNATSEDQLNGISTYNTGSASTATPSTNANIGELEGFITPSVDGVVQLRFLSETGGGSVTVRAGSFVTYSEVL